MTWKVRPPPAVTPETFESIGVYPIALVSWPIDGGPYDGIPLALVHHIEAGDFTLEEVRRRGWHYVTTPPAIQ